MAKDIYSTLKRRAAEIYESQTVPLFYRKFANEVSSSQEILQKNTLLSYCINHFNIDQEEMGHGYQHSKDVAIDAGAIVRIEGRQIESSDERLKQFVVAAQIAGLFHDIKRGTENHAVEGSKEAEKALDCYGLDDTFKGYVVVAIRNHEAFKDVVPAKDEYGVLISNALYDADKFRWGPDNFTKTVWNMLEFGNVSPQVFLNRYKNSMEYIEKIKDTFRTETGKRYGPEIIDMGLQIGRTLYPDLLKQIGD
jgi:hypothetical protein